MKMKTKRLTAVLVGLAAVALFTADASAYYHPGVGGWLSRDPGPGAGPDAPRIGTAGRAVGGGFIQRDQYADGMNLYQYVRGNPIVDADPMGERIIFISGWLQPPDYGFAKAMADSVGEHLSRTALVVREKTQSVSYWSTGGGNDGPEKALREAYRQFVFDKKASPCSLEQFVVVGFSDGATSAYLVLKDKNHPFKTDYPPAFIGLMDLVRLNYGIDQVNWSADGNADIRSEKPELTRVENWYQTTGNPSANLLWLDRGFKGRKVIGADRNTNVNLWSDARGNAREDSPGQRKAWEAEANLGHGGLYANPEVRAGVVQAVGLWYVQAAEKEAKRMRKALPWVMKGGDHW
jgi:hypothetical protein